MNKGKQSGPNECEVMEMIKGIIMGDSVDAIWGSLVKDSLQGDNPAHRRETARRLGRLKEKLWCCAWRLRKV